MSPARAALAAVVALAACGDEAAAPAADPDRAAVAAACEALDVGDNVVDAALCPRWAAAALAPEFADAATVCRRMALDLLDRAPTWAEVESRCLGRTPAEMADYFTDRPEYLTAAQRRWADRFEYNDGVVHWRYIEALDALVAGLYADEIAYDDFAVEALVAPAFVGRFFGEMRTARAFQIFLGRDAHPVERQDLSGLWAMWTVRYATDPTLDDAVYFEVVVATALCRPPLDELLCHASLYGEREVVLPVPYPDDPEHPDNVLTLDALTAADREVLEEPGRLVTGLPAFHEHAAAEALDRLTGWEASRALPEAVVALAEGLAAGPDAGSIRALERQIVTSALYLAPPGPASDAAPRWTFKPLQQVTAEAWLDTIQNALGVGVGWCDHRYANAAVVNEAGDFRFIPHDYPVADAVTGFPDFTYRDVARSLGGCPDRVNSFRFEGRGAVHALLAEQVVQFFCYRPEASGLLPRGPFGGVFVVTDSAEALTDLYRHQVRTLLARPVADDALAEFLADTVGCEGEGTCDLSLVPAQLCEALIQSAEFLLY